MAGISNMGSTFASKLLIAEVKGHSPLPDPATARLVGEDAVDGVECHRIEGIRFGEQNVTVWIERISFLVRRLDCGRAFTEETLRRQQQQVQDAVAKMPIGDPNRAMIEKGMAMRAERPAKSFQTEATTLRRERRDRRERVRVHAADVGLAKTIASAALESSGWLAASTRAQPRRAGSCGTGSRLRRR
jgi:hypothetical protein